MPNKKKANKAAEPAAADDSMPIPPAPPMIGEDVVMPTKEIVVPDNQLELSEADLDEEIAKMLTANNPAAPKNIARYNMKEKCYKHEPMVEQTMYFYKTDGWLLHRESEEARKQIEMSKLEEESMAKFQAELDKAAEGGGEAGGEKGEKPEAPDDTKQLRNQFNFSERAAQTRNFPMRDRDTITEPPPTESFHGSCSQWQIYDEYVADQVQQKIQEEIAKAKAAAKKGGQPPPKGPDMITTTEAREEDPMRMPDMKRSSKVLERMVNQNRFVDISMDFKYWDDASDAFREGEGTLLPLWKFHTEEARRKHVTSICWNPVYDDLFAVSYGSYDFLKQGSGLVCVFSLKNPTHPEYIFHATSGVMCTDFHPQHANLLAVGCYDGTVLVFDIRLKTTKPIYSANVKTGKHTDPVWQVKWQDEEQQKALQLYSVSSDGHIHLWTLSKASLTQELAMRLTLDAGKGVDEDESMVGSLAGGCCFDFNRESDHLFLVGTEEGRIHKCSKAYSSEYLASYGGHAMAVYSVRWNYLHTRMFLSGSADWTVKLWDSALPKPVMTFDLNSPVGDVAWSPFSASTFAAATSDGKIAVFDLDVNKYEPMCEQKIVKKAKLTRLAFNPKHPILLVGDDRGCVTSLKLSPNLRRRCSPGEDGRSATQMEVEKLDKVIEIALKSQVTPTEADANGAV